MSLIPIDEVVLVEVTTHHPTTGAVSDADSAPTYDVFEEATDTPILDDQTMTKRTSLTGNYRGQFTASAANGFEAGKWYSVVVTGIVNSITAKYVEQKFRVAPAESSAGVPKVDLSHWLGTAAATPTVAGVPEVDVTHFGGSAGGFTSGRPDVESVNDPVTVGTNNDKTGYGLADGAITAAKFAAGAIDAAALAADAATEVATAVWAAGTRTLTSISGLGIALADKLLGYVQLLARKDSGLATDRSTELDEINADEGSGTGAFANTTDSQEAIRDNMGTPQTGDSFARLGAPAGASIAADIAAIEAQTDDIGAAGAGLTAIPWNAAWDAEVQSEVQDAIEANHLDHLLAATYDPASKPGAADALLNELVENDGGVARYTANALEQAPTGGSAPSAADIADAVWEEAIADHSGTAGSTAEQLAAAGAAGDPWATALPGSYTSGQAGKIVGDNLNATVSSRATQTSVDTLDNLVDDLESRLGTPSDLGSGATVAANLVDIEGQTDDIGAAGAGLTAIPDSAGVTTLLSRIPSALFSGITSLAQWLGLIAGKQTGNATARTELRATGAGSGTFDETTDSQEALRDRGDSAWTTATGFSTHSAADVWAVGTRTLTAFDAAFKTGYALSSAGVQAIWDALTSALTTVGSIGKLLVDNINATISSRASQSSVDDVPTNSELTAALAAADDAVLAAIAALNNLSAAQVNAEVVDALATDTYAEPSAPPAATASLKDKIGWLAILARNAVTQTATTQALKNDAGSGNVATAAVSDDGTTFTRAEWQ